MTEPTGFFSKLHNLRSIIPAAGSFFTSDLILSNIAMKRTLSLLSVVVLGTLLGAPRARGQWVQTIGPEPHRASCVAIIGTNLLAGTSDSGVYRSIDSGSTWHAIDSGLTNLEVSFIEATGPFLFVNTLTGAFRSTDSGSTWESNELNSLGALAWSNGFLFAGSGQSIFRSSDSGATWQAMSYKMPDVITCLASDDKYLFAGTEKNGLFRSSDSGASWTEADSGLSNGSQLLAIAAEGTTILAGGGYWLSRSTDNGSSWTPVPSGSGYIDELVITDKSIFAANIGGGDEGHALLRSTDSGQTWDSIDFGFDVSAASAVAIKDSLILCETDKGIFLSTDYGKNWAPKCNGITNWQGVYALTVFDSVLFAAPDYGMFCSTDYGATWRMKDRGITLDAPSSRGYAAMVNELYTATGEGIYRTADTSDTWALSRIGDFQSITIDHGNIFGGTYDRGIFESTDGGLSWAAQNNGLSSSPSTGYKTINCFLGIGGNLFVGTSMGLFRLSDSSLWTNVSGVGYSNVSALCQLNRYILAGGFSRSTDSGLSWSVVNNGLLTSAVNAFCISGENIFAGTISGVFLSTDYGNSWTDVSDGLVGIRSLVADGPYLFAGAEVGVWRRPLSDFGISSVAPQQPVSVAPISVFPNPISGRATIAVTTASPGYADVRVVSALGVELARVFSGELSAGEHSFTWDADKIVCATGMYECVVRMNGSIQYLPIIVE